MEYVSEVYDYDRKQLTAYQETVQQVADLKDQLNAQLAEMEELKISYEDQASSLQALIAEKSAAMDNFDAQLASAKVLQVSMQIRSNSRTRLLQMSRRVRQQKRQPQGGQRSNNSKMQEISQTQRAVTQMRQLQVQEPV